MCIADVGETSDKAGEAVGVSGKTYERLRPYKGKP